MQIQLWVHFKEFYVNSKLSNVSRLQRKLSKIMKNFSFKFAKYVSANLNCQVKLSGRNCCTNF